jgi:hypothetical protein
VIKITVTRWMASEKSAIGISGKNSECLSI